MDLQPKRSQSRLYTDDDYDTDRSPTDPPQQHQLQQEHNNQLPAIQCDFDAASHEINARVACQRELELLHRDLEDLNGIFHRLHGAVAEQGEAVTQVEQQVDDSHSSVVTAEKQLRQALTYKKAMYPMAGALLGTCLGGPVGMLAGLKMGGLAAVGCGILGFTGGAVIKNSEQQQVLHEGNVDGGLEAIPVVDGDRKND